MGVLNIFFGDKFFIINCFRCLDGIPECVIAQFHEAAEELIRDKGATSAVAAALAYIAGAKDIVSRSLLSAHQVCYKAWRCTNGLVWIYFKGSACIVPSKCVYGGREASHVQINIFQPIKVHVYIMCSGTCTHVHVRVLAPHYWMAVTEHVVVPSS